jgi:hypothetical protein
MSGTVYVSDKVTVSRTSSSGARDGTSFSSDYIGNLSQYHTWITSIDTPDTGDQDNSGYIFRYDSDNCTDIIISKADYDKTNYSCYASGGKDENISYDDEEYIEGETVPDMEEFGTPLMSNDGINIWLWELDANENNYCTQSARIAKTDMNVITSKDYKLVLQIYGPYSSYNYKVAAPVNGVCPSCDNAAYTGDKKIGALNQCLPSYQVTYNAGNQNQCFCIRGNTGSTYVGPVRIYKTIN